MDLGRPIAGPANNWGYRPHLDGLRAVAVYLVVLFHSGSFRFRGGFVGVDLFFVLSGFLVTNVLLADAAAGEIRFSRFYARRARRLIPAASVTIIGVALTAVMVSTRLDRLNIIPDARAASLWYANWHFIAEANSYFAAGDLESPLLHFWSLAVEEQFYLVFPLVIFAVIRLCGGRLKRVATVLGVLLVVGVALQLWWASIDANRAYLGTDARLYQPLAGVVLAVVLWRIGIPRRWRVAGDLLFGAAIVALVALAVVAPTLSASWRGFGAATAATLAILGSEMSPSGWVARGLRVKPVRYLGMISYGTYLWHWPVVAFSRRLLEVSPIAMFLLSAVLGTALAALSYSLIEQPARTAQWLRSRSATSVALGVSTAVVVGVMISPYVLRQQVSAQVTPIVPPTVPDTEVKTPVPRFNWEAIRDDRLNAKTCEQPDGSDCLLRSGVGQTVFIVGDSHAKMWTPAFLELADKHDWTVYLGWSPGCLWPKGVYLDMGLQADIDRCLERRPTTFQQIDAVDPDLIVFSERGVGATRGFAAERTKALATTNDAYAGLDGSALLGRGAIDSVRAVTSDPGRRVLLIEPIPEVAQHPLDCLSGADFVEQCNFAPITGSFEKDIYREIAASSPQVASIDLSSQICSDVCPAMVRDVVVRRDQSHLTDTFVLGFADRFDVAIQQLE